MLLELFLVLLFSFTKPLQHTSVKSLFDTRSYSLLKASGINTPMPLFNRTIMVSIHFILKLAS